VAVADRGPGVVSVLLQAPTVALSKTGLKFPAQLVGTGSASQTITLTNTGYLTLKISSLSIAGTNAPDFGQTNSCDSSLAVGARCTINITFMPTHVGPRTASVT